MAFSILSASDRPIGMEGRHTCSGASQALRPGDITIACENRRPVAEPNDYPLPMISERSHVSLMLFLFASSSL
jgi:hypothetical protein